MDTEPTGRIADAIRSRLEEIRCAEIERHSLRTFHFAEMLARDTGAEREPGYDRGLLFAATALHDLGLGSATPGRERFEVEGADMAAELLVACDMAESDVERVWWAIALHTSGGLAERGDVIARLTRGGVLADLGRMPGIDLERAARVHAAYARGRVAGSIVDRAVAHARCSPGAGAPYTLTGELLRERDGEGRTRLEMSLPPGW